MKRFTLVASAIAVVAFPGVASAAPPPYPEPGPGCFGQWRGGNAVFYGGAEVGPQLAARKGDNAYYNELAREYCDSLTP